MKHNPKISEEIVPKVFNITYGAYRELNNFSIKIEDGKIIPSYEFSPFHNSDKYEDIIPSKKDWIKFWKKMDNIDIWSWLKNYEPQGMAVLDGYYWNINIEFGDKKIKSSGSNAYPGDAANEIVDVDMSKLFKKFLAAVKELTGIEIKR